MFKVKAKFIGKDSLGFVNGNIYDLMLIIKPQINGGIIDISTQKSHKSSTWSSGRLRCEYYSNLGKDSWEWFITDWQILHFENDNVVIYIIDDEIHSKVNKGLKQAVREYKLNKVLS
jgi:hypothetical protein